MFFYPLTLVRSECKETMIMDSINSIPGECDVTLVHLIVDSCIIPRYSFEGWKSIRTIEIKGPCKIKSNVFYETSALESVTLSENCIIDGDAIFAERETSFSISIPLANPNIEWINQTLLAKVKDKLTLIHADVSKEGNYILPKNVTALGSYCCYKCRQMHSFQFHDGIIEIGKGCLCEIEVLLVIPENAPLFKHSTQQILVFNLVMSYIHPNVTYLKIPEGVIRMERNTLINGEMMELIFPSSITKISGGRIKLCKQLKNVVFPRTFQNIAKGAFQSCSIVNLTLRRISTKMYIDKNAFLDTRFVAINLLCMDKVNTNLTQYNDIIVFDKDTCITPRLIRASPSHLLPFFINSLCGY